MSESISEPGSPIAEGLPYSRDGMAIYRQSFAIIRAEADLLRFMPDEADIAVRMIHACGQVEIAHHIVFGGNLVAEQGHDVASAGPDDRFMEKRQRANVDHGINAATFRC